MDYVDLAWQLPAIVSGTTIVAYLWPRKMLPHFAPFLTFLVALVVLALPAYPDLALALVLPVAIIHKVVGVSLTGHDPVPVKLPTVKQVREKIRPPKFQLKNFVTRAYPDPATEPKEVEEPAPVVEDAGNIPEPATVEQPIKSHIPPL
jgi:hypothetical protein